MQQQCNVKIEDASENHTATQRSNSVWTRKPYNALAFHHCFPIPFLVILSRFLPTPIAPVAQHLQQHDSREICFPHCHICRHVSLTPFSLHGLPPSKPYLLESTSRVHLDEWDSWGCEKMRMGRRASLHRCDMMFAYIGYLAFRRVLFSLLHALFGEVGGWDFVS